MRLHYSPKLRSGRGTTMREALGGQSVEMDVRNTWRHPWQVTPLFLGGPRHWVCTIKPGFVNQQCPIWRTSVQSEKADGRDYGINPLSGEKFFSSFVFKNTVPGGNEVVDIPLYLDPAIPMQWRALGWDSAGSEGVPAFFRDRGVQPSAVSGLTADGLPQDLTDKLTPPKGLRLLRVCDLWLHQPRAALTSKVLVLPGFATGGFTLHQTLGIKPADPGDALQIMAGEFDELQVPPIDAVADNYEEFPWDELLLARVYVLSPPDVKIGSEPDATWTPFVEHHLFWNLMYRNTPFVPPVPSPNAPFVLLLAGGAAQPIINYLTSSINDGLLRVFNVTRGASLAGHFWTATGGGSLVSVPPPVPPAPLRNGLDKGATIAARQLTARDRVLTASLDPGFPYRAISIDPTIFFSTN